MASSSAASAGTWLRFVPLYLATLLLQLAAGLLCSWVALRMLALAGADFVPPGAWSRAQRGFC